jgi:hypothetical protein
MLIKTDNLGVPCFTNKDLIDMIYSGHIDKCHVVLCEPSADIDQFNAAMEAQGFPLLSTYIPLDVDQQTFDNVCQSEWFMPNEYKNIDVYAFLVERLYDKLQIDRNQPLQDRVEFLRLTDELTAFKQHGMENLLRYMIYLVNFMREHKIIWGVGRGSSVASYILYLLDVHRIDSIQYDLDWREFLR